MCYIFYLPNKTCSLSFSDIKEYYPSITEELLVKALEFAKNYTPIDGETTNVIMHCRKSILFGENKTWIKNNNSLIDVTMGSFDGAEICELVGLYLLHAITLLINTNDVGLYRDDGLAVLRNISGPKTEQLKKKLIKLFQKNALSITTETGLTQTDFLDVTFNLLSGTHRPFRKPNDNPQYIHFSSNHPPNIKKQLPAMIRKP